jgi:hypothetical protein
MLLSLFCRARVINLIMDRKEDKLPQLFCPITPILSLIFTRWVKWYFTHHLTLIFTWWAKWIFFFFFYHSQNNSKLEKGYVRLLAYYLKWFGDLTHYQKNWAGFWNETWQKFNIVFKNSNEYKLWLKNKISIKCCDFKPRYRLNFTVQDYDIS